MSSSLLDHLEPVLDESRSVRLSLFLLVTFTLGVLALAVWFKVLQHFMEEPVYEFEEKNEDGSEVEAGLVKKVRRFLGGRSDIELQKLLQSSSSVPGLIFTLVAFVSAYATRPGDLVRVLLGLAGLGSQVVFLTWIYVESWGEFANSFILTGALVTAAYNTLSPVKCPSLECLKQENSWEPVLITSMFYFILATSLLHVILAAAPLLGLLNMSRQKILNRVYKTLDDHLCHMVDDAVLKSSDKKQKRVSESLLSEVVVWCMQEKYLGEMQEKVYRGLKRTELRVVVSAVPTLVLAVSAIWLKSSWRWGGAAAVALMAASCSAMLLGFLCARQREHRLPLCFSRGIDIIESFENATSDLFGLNRRDFDMENLLSWDITGDGLKNNTLSTMFEEHGVDWVTCDYMVIQTLGLAELGHFENQQSEWKTAMPDGSFAFVDPNSNESLRAIQELSEDSKGLVARRERIMMALKLRDPVKIGPTAISKIAGVMMAINNAIHYMKKLEGHNYKV